MLDQIFNWIHKIYSIPDLVGFGGYIILFLVIFSETGLFAGFFLPGDSLLVSAGIFAAAGKLDIILLNVVLIAAAIIGDSTGYYFGQRVGKKLFNKEKSHLFKKRHLLRAKAFYERHGGKTILLARFVPVIRTFAPIVAGAADMKYRRFAAFNIIGGVLWVMAMTLIGYFIGSVVPDIEKNIGTVVIAVVALSLVPAIVEYIRDKRRSGTGPA